MSAATPTRTTSAPTDPRGPSSARLVLVELRKSLDTRTGRWLALALLLLIVAAATYQAADASGDGSIPAARIFSTAWDVVRMLLPVLGVASMTNEWSQRTALTTFALVPRRGRVLAAKLGAALLVSVATVLLTAVVTLVVVAVAASLGSQPVQWDSLARHVVGALAGGVCFMGLGAAVGLLLQQTALALVVYFVAPTLVTVVGATLVGDRVDWIAPVVAIGRVDDLDLAGAVGPSLVALTLWIVLPLAVGTIRWLRRDVP